MSQGTGSNTNVFTITPTTNTANGGTFSLTFRASDGVNIASAVASFTLQFIITNSNYTAALITSVGANNAVNNSFTDSSGNSHAITAVGEQVRALSARLGKMGILYTLMVLPTIYHFQMQQATRLAIRLL